MNTFLLVMALYSYVDVNTAPIVVDSFDTEIECNKSLANLTSLGYSFADGLGLGNVVEKDTDDEFITFFCVKALKT